MNSNIAHVAKIILQLKMQTKIFIMHPLEPRRGEALPSKRATRGCICIFLALFNLICYYTVLLYLQLLPTGVCFDLLLVNITIYSYKPWVPNSLSMANYLIPMQLLLLLLLLLLHLLVTTATTVTTVTTYKQHQYFRASFILFIQFLQLIMLLQLLLLLHMLTMVTTATAVGSVTKATTVTMVTTATIVGSVTLATTVTMAIVG